MKVTSIPLASKLIIDLRNVNNLLSDLKDGRVVETTWPRPSHAAVILALPNDAAVNMLSQERTRLRNELKLLGVTFDTGD